MPRIPRKWKRLLHKYRWYLAVTGLVIMVMIPFIWYEGTVHASLQKGAAARLVNIPLGSGVREVADSLHQQGIIGNSFAFDLYVLFHGQSEKLHSGVYSLTPAMSIASVVKALSGGQQAEIRLTIPEGTTMQKIAQLIEKAHITSASAFLAAASDQGVGEGYFFPDTYFFLPDTPASVVVEKLHTNFTNHLTPQLIAGFSAQGLSPADGVTLASLVEHEARTTADRKMVAGVFLNRLHRGMTLGSDVALQYALGGFTHVLTQDDLASNSPYNLRSKKGLPPTPIGSPGLDALTAVANPTPSSYIFFIAGRDGTLHYAATLQEHNENIAKYL